MSEGKRYDSTKRTSEDKDISDFVTIKTGPAALANGVTYAVELRIHPAPRDVRELVISLVDSTEEDSDIDLTASVTNFSGGRTTTFDFVMPAVDQRATPVTTIGRTYSLQVSAIGSGKSDSWPEHTVT